MYPCFVEVLQYIGSVVTAHKESLTVSGVALSLAVAKNWPELIPKTPQEIWTWARSSVQTALPIYRMTGTPPPNPIPPVTSPDETKK